MRLGWRGSPFVSVTASLTLLPDCAIPAVLSNISTLQKSETLCCQHTSTHHQTTRRLLPPNDAVVRLFHSLPALPPLVPSDPEFTAPAKVWMTGARKAAAAAGVVVVA